MIQKIKLQNFQNHEDTEVQFAPGVNIIVGKSDSGKSAIIRALRWVIDNKPQGDGFRSHWGGDTQVSLFVEDNEIRRLRTASKNEYHLKDMVFKAMGNSLPEEITDAISMDSVNSQFQIDLPFLFSESPGEVARYFNRIAGLDKIDSSLKEVQSRINNENRKIQHLQEDLEIQKIEVEKYRNLSNLQKVYDRISQKREKQNRLSDKIDKIIEIIETLTKVQKMIHTLPDTTQFRPIIISLEDKLESEKQNKKKEITIDNILIELNAVRAGISQANKLTGKHTIVLELLRKTQENKQNLNEITSLSNTVEEITEIQERIKNGKMYNRTLKIEYKELLPEICPICGTKL
jgi:DNA repair protein SbcC/Rad50